MPHATRAWHITVSAFLQREGYETVQPGVKKSMWKVTIDGHRILLGAHTDNFVRACADRPVTRRFSKTFTRHIQRDLRRQRPPNEIMLMLGNPTGRSIWSPSQIFTFKKLSMKGFINRLRGYISFCAWWCDLLCIVCERAGNDRAFDIMSMYCLLLW